MQFEYRFSLFVAVLLCCSLCHSTDAADSFEAVVRPFIKRHCVSCHGPETQEGDRRLDQLSTDLTELEVAEQWQFVLDELNGATMPPEDEPQPTAAELTRVLEALTYRLQEVKALHAGKDRTTVMRRLNKREYLNAIRHLTGIALRPETILPDEVQAEFDTHGDGLFLSAFQLEKYREWGRTAIEQALSVREPLTPQVREIQATETVEHSLSRRIDGQVRAIGKLKSARQKATAEQELAGLRQVHRGLQELGSRKAFSIVGDTEFKDIGRDALTKGEFYQASFRCEVRKLPRGKRAFLVVCSREVEVTAASDKPMNFTVTLHYPGGRFPQADRLVTDRTSPVGQQRRKPGRKKAEAALSADSPVILLERLTFTGPLVGHAEGIPSARVLGEARKKDESEHQYATRVIRDFSTRAYRGKVPATDFLDACVKLYEDRRDHGMTLDEAIVEPLATVLSSAGFLLLTETARTSPQDSADQRTIATRLSLLLWSAPPDEELLSLAADGKLLTQLPKQVRRLLADDRAADFAAGFTGQWLELSKLDLVEVERDKDSQSLRQWSPVVERMLRREPAEFFLLLARENLSISNFIDSDFAVVNNRLARFYGLEDRVSEDEFQKVKLPADSPRGGLLGQAAILAMTGNGKRSSPVLRGAWVMDKILGHPAPPPPPNVPDLEEQKTGTVRQMLEAHQRQPQCASCHRNIDPIGFALESFDHTGQWRGTQSRQLKGTLNGQLPDGTKYRNFYDYTKLLLERRDGFARSLVESLSSYALGRQVGFADAAELDHILARSGGRDARLGDLIVAIVQSKAFLAK